MSGGGERKCVHALGYVCGLGEGGDVGAGCVAAVSRSGEASQRFTELVLRGRSPEVAWLLSAQERGTAPESGSVVGSLRSLEEGREALVRSRRRWARLGLTPPWEAKCSTE